jgi:hypothetical protein
MRIVVAVLGVLAVGVAAVLLAGQEPFAASRFEFDRYRPYKGTVLAWPYPALIAGGRAYALVGGGKHGIDVSAMDGQEVELQGALIERGNERGLQVRAIRSTGSGAADGIVELGEHTLRGEIVDSKCYLGVMNPGEGKVHRDCAVRCISGGIPPAFVVRDSRGNTRMLLLTGADGKAIGREVLPYAGEPVEITGRLARRGSVWVFKGDVWNIRRLS